MWVAEKYEPFQEYLLKQPRNSRDKCICGAELIRIITDDEFTRCIKSIKKRLVILCLFSLFHDKKGGYLKKKRKKNNFLFKSSAVKTFFNCTLEYKTVSIFWKTSLTFLMERN